MIPACADRHNGSRPNGYFVPKDGKGDGKVGHIRADVAPSCEYKGKTGLMIWTMYVFIRGFDIAC